MTIDLLKGQIEKTQVEYQGVCNNLQALVETKLRLEGSLRCLVDLHNQLIDAQPPRHLTTNEECDDAQNADKNQHREDESL